MVVFDKEKKIILEGKTTSEWIEMIRRSNKMSEINKDRIPVSARYAREFAEGKNKKDINDQIERINASILKAADRGDFRVPVIISKSELKEIKAKYEEYGYTVIRQNSCWYDMAVLEIRWDGDSNDSRNV